MLAQIPRALGSTALGATLLVSAMAFAAPTVTRADDCLTAPNAAAPAGSHWYYRTDLAKQRKCWYVRGADPSAQHTIAQPASDAASAQRTSDRGSSVPQPASNPASPPDTTSLALPRPAAGSAGAPMSITPADGTPPPSPHIEMLAVKPQRAVPSVTARQPLEQSAQQPQVSTTSSILETAGPAISAPQEKLSQNNAAAAPVWPDPPTAAFAPQQAPAVPTDAEATSETAGGASQVNPSITNAGIVASLTSIPIAIFPVVALGLVVVGFCFRVVTRIALAGRQRIVVDLDHSNWTDERPEHELRDEQFVTDYLQSPLVPTQTSRPLRSRRIDDPWPDGARADDPAIGTRDWIETESHYGWSDDQQPRDAVSVDPGEFNPIEQQGQPSWQDQQRYNSVKERDELIDDLHNSQLAATSDYCPDSPLPSNGGWSHSGQRKHDAAPMSEQIREREEVLETLRRDLDRLLRSPKVA
jgi:hypothetical protein